MQIRSCFPMLLGATGVYSPLSGVASGTDGQANDTGVLVLSRGYVYNGATWDRIRSTSAAVLSAATQADGILMASPGEWAQANVPAANTTATTTKAAGGAGVRHVCRSITVVLNGLAAAAEAIVQVNLRDGATGVGTIKWAAALHVIPGGTTGVSLSGLNIFGTANTAMTLEFAAAGGASTTESVSLSGYSTV